MENLKRALFEAFDKFAAENTHLSRHEALILFWKQNPGAFETDFNPEN